MNQRYPQSRHTPHEVSTSFLLAYLPYTYSRLHASTGRSEDLIAGLTPRGARGSTARPTTLDDDVSSGESRDCTAGSRVLAVARSGTQGGPNCLYPTCSRDAFRRRIVTVKADGNGKG